MSPFQMSIGILIPGFNPDHDRLKELIRRIHRICADSVYQILIVDDGSRNEIMTAQIDEKNLRVIRFEENYGKGAALKKGFEYFLHRQPVDLILTLDSDLQHLPEKIPEFIKAYKNNAGKIIIGYRSRRPVEMPLHRIISNSLTSLIISLLIGQLVRDSQCGYRLIDTAVLKHIRLTENRFHLESEMIIRAGWMKVKIESVRIPTIYNSEKSSIKNLPDTLNFISLVWRLFKERFTGNV